MWVVELLALFLSFIFFFCAFVVMDEIISLLPYYRNGSESFCRLAVLAILAMIYSGAGLVLVGVWK